MIKEYGLHLVECAKPLRYLNQEDSRLTYVLGKSMCSFLQVRDACQGPSPRSWSDGGKKWGQQRRNRSSEPAGLKMGLQSSIVCYTEPLFMPDMVWRPDLFGHGLGETLVVFSKMISISRGKS